MQEKKLTFFEGVDYSETTYELIVDSNLHRIMYTTKENIFILNF